MKGKFHREIIPLCATSVMELAEKLGVDPYTENALLRSELRRVAAIEASVRTGARFVPSPFSISGVGDANRYLGYAEKVALYEDPVEIEKLNEKMVSALQLGEREKKAGEKLLNSKSYSPPMRRSLLKLIEELSGVADYGHLLTVASNAESREIAHFYLQAIFKIAELNQSGRPIVRVITDKVIPAVVSADQGLIVPLPVDHLVWTKEVADIFRSFRANARVNYRTKRIILGGTISPRCRSELVRVGVARIEERVSFSYSL